MKKLLLFSTLTFLLILGTQHYTYSQAIGISGTGAVPDPSALLDIDATGMNPKGFLMPRLTTTQRNNIATTCSCTPAEGLEIFNITTKCFEAYVSGGWYTIACPTACTAPSAPTANAATNPCSTSFTANWTASAGATSYYLDVSTNSGFSSFVTGYNNLNVGNVTTYSVTGLSASTTYYYQLRAATTCTSVNSSYITTATNTTTAPSAPTAATHTPSSSQIVWNWNTSATATGYKWSTTNNYAGATDNAASTSYTQTSLTPLTSYTLYVWAYNGCGNSSATTLTSTTTAVVTYIEDFFSAYTYTGTGASKTITNGIDLSGQGGLVWTKKRGAAAGYDNMLWTTAQGATKFLESNNNFAEGTSATGLTAFNNNGFTIGALANVNENAETFASWTFRKAAKFFDVVTYTGDGALTQTVAHNLGVRPGMIIIKRLDGAGAWGVWHNVFDTPGDDRTMWLNETTVPNNNLANGFFRYTGQTALVNSFQVYMNGASAGYESNVSGGHYIAYLFANDVSSNGLIQCGSYVGNGAATQAITLGWEPQFILTRNITDAANWFNFDATRQFTTDGTCSYLMPNSSGAEGPGTYISPTATGFLAQNAGFNTAGKTYIYMAIRRGPMKTPTAGTQVYKTVVTSGTGTSKQTIDPGFIPDMAMLRTTRTSSGATTSSHKLYDRLRGNGARLMTAYSTYAEQNQPNWNSFTNNMMFDVSPNVDGEDNPTGTNNNINHFFRRAPGFFDVVCYAGTGSTTYFNHSLAVVPELLIVTNRTNAYERMVYSSTTGVGNYLYLNTTDAVQSGAYWGTGHTSTTFGVLGNLRTNAASNNYVAYLFATLPGVSKVGSYTGNGGTQTIACGFSTSARFILIKRTDIAGDWFTYDTVRGIVTAGNDPHLSINTTAAEVTTDDSIDSDASGFIVKQNGTTNINVSSATYIFLAIN